MDDVITRAADVIYRYAEIVLEPATILNRVDMSHPAVAEFERLTHLSDELRSMGWVSVNDRLPKKAKWSGDRVLVYTEEGYIHTGLYEGEAPDEWPDKFNDSGLITHWMPLPKPPEAK